MEDGEAPWPHQPLPTAIRAIGPWGQLDTWNHPRLHGRTKSYAVSSDVWIHANGQSYYMHLGTKPAIVDLPGPTCSCSDFAKGTCIHADLVAILRGPR